MGFLDWLFGRKRPEEMKEDGELDLESSRNLLKKRIDEEIEDFWPTVERFHSDLKSLSEQFDTSLSSLRNAVPVEKIDEQVFKIATTSRESFIRKMSQISTTVKKDIGQDIETFSEYYKSVAGSIANANMDTVKEFMSLDVAFKKETGSVIDRMKEMKRHVDYFKNSFAKRKGKIDSAKSLLDEIDSLEKKIVDRDETEKRIEQLKKEIEIADRKKAEFEKQLAELGQSEMWKNYIELTKEKEAAEADARKVIEEVVNIFASINRPLKKFANAVEEKIAVFKNKDMLKKYLESPFDAFVQDSNFETINAALDAMEGMLAEGRLVPDDKDESLRMIKDLKSTKILNSLSEKYSGKNATVKSLKEQIENHEYLKKKKRFQENINAETRRIDENRKDLDRQEKVAKKFEAEIGDMKENLKNKIREIT